MSLRGERHVYVMFMFMIYFALILFPYVPHYPIQDSGGERLLGKEILEIIAYLYPLGTCLPIEYLVLTLYMSSQSWYSCGYFVCSV